jgi:hypothetical protein
MPSLRILTTTSSTQGSYRKEMRCAQFLRCLPPSALLDYCCFSNTTLLLFESAALFDGNICLWFIGTVKPGLCYTCGLLSKE